MDWVSSQPNNDFRALQGPLDELKVRYDAFYEAMAKASTSWPVTETAGVDFPANAFMPFKDYYANAYLELKYISSKAGDARVAPHIPKTFARIKNRWDEFAALDSAIAQHCLDPVQRDDLRGQLQAIERQTQAILEKLEVGIADQAVRSAAGWRE